MYTDCLSEFLTSLAIDEAVLSRLDLSFTGDDALASCFKTTQFASSSLMAAACALAEFCHSDSSTSNMAISGVYAGGVDLSDELDELDESTEANESNESNESTGAAAHPLQTAPVHIKVDRRLASLWFDKSLVARNWSPSGVWDAIAGDYACNDSWIRLHTNAPHHRAAALRVLQCEATRDAVSAAVKNWQADELEQAVVNAGGCAARMRSLQAWQQHPQGMAVAKESLIKWQEHGLLAPKASPIASHRPLSGVRVLDLTRVLAGPVSTRFLAGYGATVLRIDPGDWDEPGVVPEVTPGKRCAHLDLKTPAGRRRLLELLQSADVLVHGYRPGAMAGLGLGEEALLQHNPALINVSLCAYGWSGPWSQRRGFDSLVQMSCGIADEGMQQYRVDEPRPLPVQALDHATGYLMAAAVLHALAQRRTSGRVLSAKLSLARTAHALMQHTQAPASDTFLPVQHADLHEHMEQTPWGYAQRVRFPVTINDVPAWWDKPACELRSSAAQWPDN